MADTDADDQLAAAALAIGELERATLGDEAVPLEEWLELTPEEQVKHLSARFVHLKTRLDSPGAAGATRKPLGPTDYPGRRPESDVTGREFW